MIDGLLADKWHGTGPYFQALAGPALMLAATCWLDRAFDCSDSKTWRSAWRRPSRWRQLGSLPSVRVNECGAHSWVYAAVALVYYWIYFLVTFVACEFPLLDFRRACLTGLLAIIVALGLGTLVHQVPNLALRLTA